MFKSFKYRIYPTKQQEANLNSSIGAGRFIWNHFLDLNIKQYEKDKTFVFYNQMAVSLPAMKKSEEFNWLSEVPSQVIQQKLQDLHTALKSSFSKNKAKKGFPCFKSRKLDESGIRFPQAWKINDKRLFLPKMKSGIKIVLDRELEGKSGQLTLRKTKTGKWFVSILCEINQEVAKKEVNHKEVNHVVGIDFGIKDFLIASDGQKFNNRNFYKSVERKTKRLSRNLSRKKKGSKNRDKARFKLAIHSEKIANRRNDFLNKTANSIAKNCDLVCLEDLAVKNMTQNRRLSKAIQDVSWAMFSNKLHQQCEKFGTNIVKINRFYPSSKTCHNCKSKKEVLGLSERTFKCSECGHSDCRDSNASKNIRDEGLRIYTVGLTGINAPADMICVSESGGENNFKASMP